MKIIPKLESVFVKHYAPNICLLNMANFAQCRNSTKNWTLLKRLTGNLLIIPYQLTKFQTPSSNLHDKVEIPFAKIDNLFKS